MITEYLIGMAGIIGIMILWMIVQQYWKKVFPEHYLDEDALAGRSDCGNCGCKTRCVNKQTQSKS